MTSTGTPNGTKTPCRLFGLLARERAVGVLLRRGPSKWVRLVKWNTEEDSFEWGQWFHGRIYERRCDLSPSGRLLIYFASKFSPRTLADHPTVLEDLKAWATGKTKERDSYYTYAWTAVSKPPWLTALALWPKGDCWHGGGLFDAENAVWLNHSPGQDRPHPKHRPKGLKVRPNPEAHGEDWPIYSKRLLRDGWTLEQNGKFAFTMRNGWRTEREEAWCKRAPSDPCELLMLRTAVDFEAYGGPYVLRLYVRRAPGRPREDLGRATWADWDHRGRLVLAKDGKLFHCEVSDTGGFGLRLIHDFNDEKPESIQSPPVARTWSSDAQ